MIALEFSKKMLMWLRSYPLDESISDSKRMAINIFASSFILVNIFTLIGETIFFIRSMNTNLGDSLYALFQIAAMSSSTYTMIVAFTLQNQMKDIFEELSKIENSNNSGVSAELMIEVNQYSERMWRKYINILVKGYSIYRAITMTLSLVLCLIILGHFDADHVQYPYKVILPWDQRTLLGYFGVMCFSLISPQAYLFVNFTFLLLFMSICLYHEAFFKMFQSLISQIGRKEGNRDNKEILCESIQFHVMVKDWFLHSAEVYSPLILIQLICSMIFLSSSIFQIDMHLRPFHFGALLQLLMGTTVSSLNLIFYCRFGKLATDSYAEMPNSLYESNWQNLPVVLQKYSIVMIANMQKPLEYHGFGVAVLNLQTLSALLRTVVSYYMMFKTLTE